MCICHKIKKKTIFKILKIENKNKKLLKCICILQEKFKNNIKNLYKLK